MVTGRQRIILDGLGAYPANGGGHLVLSICVVDISVWSAGLQGLVSGLLRYGFVVRRGGCALIATGLGSFTVVGCATMAIASTFTLSLPAPVCRWHGSELDGCRDRNEVSFDAHDRRVCGLGENAT